MIKVEKLKKSFGNNEVLKEINANIKEKEVVVVIGPSGSGKSTFLRCINLLESISGGHIYIEGIDLADKKTDINKIRTEVGMVFQQFNLFPHKSVIDNITLSPIKVRKMSKEQAEIKGMELLRKVGLEDKANAFPEFPLRWSKTAGCDCACVSNGTENYVV
nr:ATP-binding cassette domain-containing protein [Bacillus sp. T3]